MNDEHLATDVLLQRRGRPVLRGPRRAGWLHHGNAIQLQDQKHSDQLHQKPRPEAGRTEDMTIKNFHYEGQRFTNGNLNIRFSPEEIEDIRAGLLRE